MKSILPVVLFLSVYFQSFAQEKMGWIGINVGTSIMLNKQPENPGLGANLNLINFGYEIENGFGVACKWMGSAHIYNSKMIDLSSGATFETSNQIDYGAILIGPMYSIRASETFIVDCRIQSGLFWVEEKFKGAGFRGTYRTNSLKGLSAGVTLRHNFLKHWCLMIVADYNSGQESGMLVLGKRLQTISLNGGVGFRI